MVRNVRKDILIWNSCGCLNNTYRSLNTKLSLIWSHNCLNPKDGCKKGGLKGEENVCVFLFSQKSIMAKSPFGLEQSEV